MSYCTADDVRLLCGVSVDVIDTATMVGLIDVADRKCNDRLVSAGIELPIPAPSDLLRDASANYTVALIIERRSLSLSRTNSYSAEGLTYGLDTASEIARHNAIASGLVGDYIAQITQCNTHCMAVEGE